MTPTLLRLVFERLNQTSQPITLEREEIKVYPASELKRLVSRGILRNTAPTFPALTISDPSSPGRNHKFYYEPTYEVVIPQLVEVICKENEIEDPPKEYKYKGGIFELGWKKPGTHPPVAVYLSLRTENELEVVSLANRLSLGEDYAVALLIPCSIFLSISNNDRLRRWNVGVLCLDQSCTSEKWLLPWEEIFSPPKNVVRAPSLRSIDSAVALVLSPIKT